MIIIFALAVQMHATAALSWISFISVLGEFSHGSCYRSCVFVCFIVLVQSFQLLAYSPSLELIVCRITQLRWVVSDVFPVSSK